MLTLVKSVEELNKLRQQLQQHQDSSKKLVSICGGTGCYAFGCNEVFSLVKDKVAEYGLEDQVIVKQTGCDGFCERGSILIIDPPGIFYQRVKPHDVEDIVSNSLVNNQLVDRLLFRDPATGSIKKLVKEVPFYAYQKRIVLAENSQIDPTQIADYLRVGGYQAISKVLSSMSPEQVIEEVKLSGLRGRGGAGFPTGLKWELARKTAGDLKYVICNGDEGDPGAFMDRSLMEGNPHKVIEGMLVAAYAIGAERGFIYVRAEYPMAVEHLKIAIEQAHQLGLLGKNILGTGFNFDLEIKQGAGAFVCGEETALIASIEGKRGMPRLRPPYPVQSGLWEKPTSINNVETFANIPPIILNGGKWFAEIGTEKSKGTKIFSLAGRVHNTGLIEVPMGISVRDVIYKLGGGVTKNRQFKAVQMGGPLGGCVPQRYLDMPIDYDSLQSIGAAMGSGGMIVADENTCMVDLARFFMEFAQSESCGKCVPCRIGTTRMLEVLNKITNGEGCREDLQTLRELSDTLKTTSLCGLGQGAPNPVLSTLNYFYDEYIEHIEDHYCSACVCEKLVKAPCTHRCPAKVDAVSYISLIAQGRFEEALEVHRQRNPFISVCGRVCNHPCEVRCRRGEIDEPIAIRDLKRFIADWEKEPKLPQKTGLPKEEKVAVIGAGPAGLSCAYQLALSGYPVTVFEALPVAGGMLAVGIPAYRLPREVLQAEIKTIADCGVEIKTNQRLGKDFNFDDLQEQGYKAIFIAIGAHRGKQLDIPGENSQGVLDGVAFLRQAGLDEKVKLGDRVAVIGGGDVAMDAARTALRLGAKEVFIVYRRNREEMPAYDWDVKEAEEEGIKFLFQTQPIEIVAENNKVVGLKCLKTSLEGRDKNGRLRPVPVKDSEFVFEVDTIIPAIGQSLDDTLARKLNLEVNEKGFIKVDENQMTSIKGVFAGGDGVSGPRTVVEAIGQGQKAAFSIEKYFRGHSEREDYLKKASQHLVEQLEAEPSSLPRQTVKAIDSRKRIGSFVEVVPTFTKEQAIAEAKRCLRCDLE
jgi:NADH-quinone oxidoreductase subunit F